MKVILETGKTSPSTGQDKNILNAASVLFILYALDGKSTDLKMQEMEQDRKKYEMEESLKSMISYVETNNNYGVTHKALTKFLSDFLEKYGDLDNAGQIYDKLVNINSTVSKLASQYDYLTKNIPNLEKDLKFENQRKKQSHDSLVCDYADSLIRKDQEKLKLYNVYLDQNRNYLTQSDVISSPSDKMKSDIDNDLQALSAQLNRLLNNVKTVLNKDTKNNN